MKPGGAERVIVTLDPFRFPKGGGLKPALHYFLAKRYGIYYDCLAYFVLLVLAPHRTYMKTDGWKKESSLVPLCSCRPLFTHIYIYFHVHMDGNKNMKRYIFVDCFVLLSISPDARLPHLSIDFTNNLGSNLNEKECVAPDFFVKGCWRLEACEIP